LFFPAKYRSKALAAIFWAIDQIVKSFARERPVNRVWKAA
jgi:hypothetical protein